MSHDHHREFVVHQLQNKNMAAVQRTGSNVRISRS